MRRLALFPILVILAASGCQAWTGALAPAREDGGAAAERTAAIYSAVIRQLVLKDHTFGQGPAPFKRVFVVDGAVGSANDLPVGMESSSVPFFPAVKQKILEALPDLPPVRFVADPDTVIVDRNGCAQVKGGGALISLGPVKKARGGAVTVANGLFIACLGGQWLTYVLEPQDGSWRVVGTTGPVVVS
jgi:hypothetical protein